MIAQALAGLRATVLAPDHAPARRRADGALWPLLAVAVAVHVGADLGGVRIDAASSLVRAGLAVAAAGPLALVHVSPLVAWRLAALVTLVTVPPEVAPGGIAWPWHPVQLVVLPATVLAVALRHRTAVVAWTTVLTGTAMVVRVASQDAVTVVVLVTVVAVIGIQVRRRVVARQAAELTLRALADQRALIARELHDVVGHHMSLIAVRAESAPYRLHDRPEQQRAEFTAIAGASRDALNDMRRLVGAMAAGADRLGADRSGADRSGADRSGADRSGAGRLGVGDVRAVAERATAAGLTVRTSFDPAAERIPVCAESALAVNRVVQEALSNVAHHAPGSTAHLTVDLAGDVLRVGVRNTGATRAGGRAPEPARAGGHGLAGMRRRVAALGGTLTAGPTADGGYRVDATVPVRQPASRPSRAPA